MNRTDAWGRPIQFRTCTSVPFLTLVDAQRARDAYIGARLSDGLAKYGYSAKVVKRDDRWYVATDYFTDSTPDWLAGFRACLEAMR